MKQLKDDLEFDWEGSGRIKLPEEPPVRDRKKENIFVKVEQKPKIKGGIKSLYRDINYPRKAKIADIEGTIQVQFFIDTEGNAKNAEVIRGIGGRCDKEALRAVKELTFKPGRQRGRAVQVQMTLAVRFQLQ